MNKQNFFRMIWYDNVEYVRYLLGDAIKILATIVSLKFIMIVLSLLFTEKPKIIQYMEIASYIGILTIFIIYVAFDVYKIMKKLKVEGSDEHK